MSNFSEIKSKLERGLSVHNTSDGTIGIVTEFSNEKVSVITANGKKDWIYSEIEIFNEE